MKRIAVLIGLTLLFGCGDVSLPPAAGTILFPRESVFEEGETILFKAETSADSILWNSSIDGDLGSDNAFTGILSSGEHTIRLYAGATLLDSVRVTVKILEYRAGRFRRICLTGDVNTVRLPPGAYSPVLFSFGSEPVYSTVPVDGDGSRNIGTAFREPGPVVKRTDYFDKKSFYFTVENRGTHLPRMRDLGPARTVTLPETGFTRKFRVADTSGVNPSGDVIEARLAHASDNLRLWVDVGSNIDESVLAGFLTGLSERALPRVISIWGKNWADVDGDGAVSVLITPLINRQNTAIGFFNPGDLYPFDDDIDSPDYNLLSNEADMLYLADPSDSPGVFAYSVGSILATFCHELTHLISFSHKVYFPESNDPDLPRGEELFLDEGIAHLTESLCGYGVSGGNLAFFAGYLGKPWEYSLGGADFDGSFDSAGKRGGSSAFLSWLFWKFGGAVWDSGSPGVIRDAGGIAFLRKLLISEYAGWKNLSYACGQEAYTLFEVWINEIDAQCRGAAVRGEIPLDPYGGEALSISPFYGELDIDGKTYCLNGPERRKLSDRFVIIPFSAIWGYGFTLALKRDICIPGDDGEGRVIARFNMY